MSKIHFVGLALAAAVVFSAFVVGCQTTTAPGGILLMGSWGSDQGRLTGTQVNTVWSGSCGSIGSPSSGVVAPQSLRRLCMAQVNVWLRGLQPRRHRIPG